MNEYNETTDDNSGWKIEILQTIKKQNKQKSEDTIIFKRYKGEDVQQELVVDKKFHETIDILFSYRMSEDEVKCIMYIGKKQYTGRAKKGVIHFKWRSVNFAGIYDINFNVIKKNGDTYKIILYLDILSKFDKDGNDKNFFYLLNTLRKKHFEIYSLFNPTRMPKNKEKLGYPTPLEQFKILQNNMKKLEKVVYQISQNPNKKLIKEIYRDKFYMLDSVDYNVIYDIAVQGGGIIHVPNNFVAPELQNLLVDTDGTRYIPDDVIIYRTATSYNVFENQLLKRFLKMIEICSKQVESELRHMTSESMLEKKFSKKLKEENIEQIDQYIDHCKKIYKKAECMGKCSFLEGVTETENIRHYTHVLQQDMNYKKFYNIFKEFMKINLDFSKDINLSILKMPELYEYWILVQVIDILCSLVKDKKGWKIKDHFIKKKEFGYLFEFRRGKRSLIDLHDKEKKISLFYQKTYDTLAGKQHRPDLTLEIKIGDICHILILDPKYRSKMISGDINDPESAMNKMHAYIHAMTIKEKNIYVDAAYTIYLGEDDPENYKDIGIGGMYIFPSEDNIEDINKLKEIIENFINSH